MPKNKVWFFLILIFTNAEIMQSKPLRNDITFEVLTKSFEIKFAVDSITVEQLNRIKKNKLPLLIYDVRHPDEQSISIIPGAIRIVPNGVPTKRKDFQEFIDKYKGNANATIVFYCSVGYRSSKMASEIKKILKLKNNSINGIPIKNLHGGLFLWAKNNYNMIEPSTRKKTVTVHGYNSWWAGFVKKPVKVVIQPEIKD